MFETLTSTMSSILSIGHTTLASATPTTLILDANATEFWNATERITENVYSSCDPDPQNTEFNCSVEEYLSYYLGAKQMPLETAIWVSLFCNICGNFNERRISINRDDTRYVQFAFVAHSEFSVFFQKKLLIGKVRKVTELRIKLMTMIIGSNIRHFISRLTHLKIHALLNACHLWHL